MNFRFILMMGFLAFLPTACSTEENTIETQRTAIETYLNGQNKGYDEALGEQGIYRHIDNMDREGRGEEPQTAVGDQVVMDYALYSFGSGPSQLYYTNLPGLQEELGDFNTAYWPTLPETVVIGTTPLMKGLESGLVGCRRNDNVEIYLTYDLGFGGKPTGLVPAETPLVWLITIHDVIKQ